MMTRTPTAIPTVPRPWWREPMVWLVIGGPAAVVVAGLATAVIAVRGADLPLDTRATSADRPALQGRNHAATPAAPAPPHGAAR